MVDSQPLSRNENRALEPSVSLGSQSLSTRLKLPGTPPLWVAREKSATTVILPSVEHTRDKNVLGTLSTTENQRALQENRASLRMSSVLENEQDLIVKLWMDDGPRGRMTILKMPKNPFNVTSYKTHAAQSFLFVRNGRTQVVAANKSVLTSYS